jgi:prepilin-type N-terminal cleavage/methylation domain-containing protein
MESTARRGFTLFELLIVISIMAILLVGGITNWRAQVQRAFDAERKGDLSKLKAALEHYTTDHGCYPQVAQMTCNSTIFAAYNMPKVLCDPEGDFPYLYQPVDPTDLCHGYRLYTILKMKKDPDIESLGCNREEGCGVLNHPEYNYGVSSGDSIVQ